MRAYTLVSLQRLARAAAGSAAAGSAAAGSATAGSATVPAPAVPVSAHPPWAPWATDAGWKHHLNTLRLLLQPFVCAALLLPWLRLFDLPDLERGRADACALMNAFHLLVPT